MPLVRVMVGVVLHRALAWPKKRQLELARAELARRCDRRSRRLTVALTARALLHCALRCQERKEMVQVALHFLVSRAATRAEEGRSALGPHPHSHSRPRLWSRPVPASPC